MDETTNNINKIFELIFKTKDNENEINKVKEIIDINSPDVNYLESPNDKNKKYDDINDSKYYHISNHKLNSENIKNNYENINDISFNKNMNKNNNNNSNNHKTFLTPPTPTLNNLSISNNNQNAIFEEYENLLNNFNEKILNIQKDLNNILINSLKYTEKELFQIDSNQKFSIKNSTNNLLNINNSTFINLNLEYKNSDNILDDSLFLNNKETRKKNLDETNIIQKNNITCNYILANNPNSNLVYIIENIFSNIQKIKSYVKLVTLSLNKKNNDCENKDGN